MEKNNIVISGYYGFSNAGDEAMLFAVLRALHYDPKRMRITVISGDPRRTENTFRVHAVSRFDGYSILKSVYQSDLLISGGGSLLQDVTSWKSMMYYLSIIGMGIFFRKKVFLYSQGIGPVRYHWGRWILRTVMNHVDAITVRDSESKFFLEQLGVKNRIYYTADAVLSLSPVPHDIGREILRKNHIPTNKKLIGISIRRWMNTEVWTEQLKNYIIKINGKEEYNFVFIPMQFPEDYKTAKEFCDKIPHTFILSHSYGTEELMSLIGNLDLLIGIRLHALIFAALMHVPFIGISYDPKIDSFLQAVNEKAIFGLDDFDEERYQYVSSRLDTLNTLKKKYGPTLEDVFKFAQKVKNELGKFETGDLDEEKIQKQLADVENKLSRKAKRLHKQREQTARELEEKIKKELADLYMEKARFSIRINETDSFTKLGTDQVIFMIAPNPGESLMPLVKIVSGGEQSRLILALKAIFSRVEPVGTMIFDEIDTGVSGRVSAAIGKKMHAIGQEKQVITITHSPQVAAAGDQRYSVVKQVKDGATYTQVGPLTQEEAITAIAQMMAGSDVTDAAKRNAADLMESFKK